MVSDVPCRLFIIPVHAEFSLRKIFLQIPLDEELCILLYRPVLYRRVEVVQNGIQFDLPVFDGFQAEQCVVDTAQFAGSDKQQRVSLLRNIVNRQQFVGKRHHQASGSLEQDNVVTAAQLFLARSILSKSMGRPSMREARCGEQG